jgi:hypothetical protein
MWEEKEIKKLRKHAFDTFQTEIPLSGEIEKIQIFLNQSQMGFKKMSPKIIKTNNVTLQWVPNFWTFPMEVDIPDCILDGLREECKRLLDTRCDELARLSEYSNTAEKS